jgi:integrase
LENNVLTFGSLKPEMQHRCALKGDGKQVVANLLSALNSFMSNFQFDDESAVGSHLRVSFYRRLNEHVDTLAGEGRSSSYIANRKCLLGRWHRLTNELDRAAASHLQVASPLQNMLREFVGHVGSAKRLAAEAGISISTLNRWLAGASPNQKAIPSLRRLESFFALPPGALLELAGGDRNSSARDGSAQSSNTGHGIGYRQRLKKALRFVYRLKEVEGPLSEEWSDYRRYKTCLMPRLKRQQRGKWRIRHTASVIESPARWYCFEQGKYVPSASSAWVEVSSYLGWLTLTQDEAGGGLAQKEVQTLTWLLNTQRLEQFVEWRIARSGGILHGGLLRVLQIVISMTHPETGYLTQTPHLASNLAFENLLPWNKLCAETFTWATTLKRSVSPELCRSRDSFEPIRGVLELERPIDAVADMVVRMRERRPATGGLAEAVWSRDLALIQLLASNPVRAENIKLMTYSADNSGNLYQDPSGVWWLRFSPESFKNTRGAAGDRPYNMPIHESAWLALERYLKRFRPMLPFAAELPYVFLSAEQAGDPRPWGRMNRHVESLTRRYLRQCPGVGPHAFRHIVATAILKASPNDWATAAMVLHDREDTVRQHYAHLASADGGRRMQSILASSFARM